MIEQKPFSGIMNLDDANENIPLVHHRIAFNGRFVGPPGNTRFENIPGTILIPNSNLPAGNNECIGSFYDGVNQRIFWFNYNSTGKNGIYYYDLKTKTVIPLLISFTNSATDILNFSPNFPIPSVVLLYTTEDDGDILHWTDRLNRPMKLNIKDAIDNIYGATWIIDYLTVARPMPLIAPVCEYKDDSTVTINNLRKKLYQFRDRWSYKDLTTSTWSPYSKLFAPANPDDIAKDIDEQKNNRIDVTINTGNADVLKIEISARQTLESTFSDPFSVIVLDKAELGLIDNQLYTYSFFNDSSYVSVDLLENNLLFDDVPKLANTMELLNGNVIIYGGITENYDFDETLDVDLAVSLTDFSTVGAFTLAIVYNQSYLDEDCPSVGDYVNTAAFQLGGVPDMGDIYTINFTGLSPSSAQYVVGVGDDIDDVGNGLATALNAMFVANSIPQYSASYNSTLKFLAYGGTVAFCDGNYQQQFLVSTIDLNFAGGGATIDGVANSIYKHKSRYGLGLVYFDKYGVTDGVKTDATKLLFETLEVTTTGDTRSKINKLDLTINSQPPIWAWYYAVVRTANLSVQALLSTVSCTTKKDTNYAYIEITNQQDNQSNYPAYSFLDGDRVRILGKYGDAVTTVYDFPIASFKTDPTIGGSPATGDFIVVPFDAVLTAFGTVGNDNYTIEIYTPAANINLTQQFFYEFGENYQVLNPGTAQRAHQGLTQDQIVGTQPALFTFTRGDFYMKTRQIPFAANLSSVTAVIIVDQSVSDFFPSKVVGNGRAFVVDPTLKETFFSATSRWGLAYQRGTNINQTNRFFPENFDDIDIAKGSIQRFKTRDRILRVFQNRGCGQYGIFAKYIQSNNGNDLVTTDNIITKDNISYYEGEFGLGDQYCGLVSAKIQDYFVDPVRGYLLRLSQDGIIPISEIYKGQFYIRQLLTPYNKPYLRPNGFKSKIIGFYDFFDEQYVPVLQGGILDGKTINNYAFSFNEVRNGFSSFYDYTPDWITCVEDITYSWKNGQLYIHNGTSNGQFTRFYGVNYYPSVQLIFNDKVAIKKVMNAIAYESNQIWSSENNGDIFTSLTNPQTGLLQQSQLKEVDYEISEGLRYASFLRDVNSMSNPEIALVEGDYLTGTYISVKLTYKGNDFAWLFAPYINYQLSPRNF